MSFKLEETARGQSDDDLLHDLRRCAETMGRSTITIAQYESLGKFHPSTMIRRFGSWPKALALARLEPSRSKIGISNDELFENIKSMWLQAGRQPRYSEVKVPASLYSTGTYENRFGSWSKALQEFVIWVNSATPYSNASGAEVTIDQADNKHKTPEKRRTRREISDRQRFRILVRDGFRCQSCGASPLVSPGVELHVDHILPWSKGGETVDENLETKCRQCNLGKGNAFDA